MDEDTAELTVGELAKHLEQMMKHPGYAEMPVLHPDQIKALQSMRSQVKLAKGMGKLKKPIHEVVKGNVQGSMNVLTHMISPGLEPVLFRAAREFGVDIHTAYTDFNKTYRINASGFNTKADMKSFFDYVKILLKTNHSGREA